MAMTSRKQQDRLFMARALALAVRSGRAVRPNPRVGAVLARNGRVIAAAYHSRFGGPHAEVKALQKAGPAARGATLYVTLEPCSSYGKTAPCTDVVIGAGVSRVVIGCRDRNPANADKAPAIFRKAGIRVTVGVLEKECSELNRDFFTWVVRGKPYTVLKLALSLDGKIATRTGQSRWIGSAGSRRCAHFLRSRSDAVLVGITTVLADNPRLTVRMGYRNPGLKRVVLDSRGRIPLSSRLVRRRDPGNTILAATSRAPAARLRKLARRGVSLLQLPVRSGRVDLKSLFRQLAGAGVMRLLVEGGGETAASVLEAGLVDEVHLFIAPVIVGGRSAVPAVGGRGVKSIKDAFRLTGLVVERVGEDIHLHGFIKNRKIICPCPDKPRLKLRGGGGVDCARAKSLIRNFNNRIKSGY
ncbi:MAG: bifunctional diaminohydroxyphosphoribosylaminopyrimidine deaminase/5-amino-6-(5-phosphoribosylamino)uracil reductase RibD [PVC group bacterium]